MVSILFVNRQLFHKAPSDFKQVRFIHSDETRKWYIPISDLAVLLGTSAPRFSKHALCYKWNTEKDGSPLPSATPKQPLLFYFEAKLVAELFLSAEQAKEFGPFFLAPAPAAPAAQKEKREREKTIGSEEHNKPLRKRGSPPPPPPPPPQAAEVKRINFVLSHPKEKNAPGVNKAPPLPPPAAAAAAAASVPQSPYEQIVREWFVENKQLLQEQAIERLMEKEDVRHAAIERVAKELALAARPTAKEMIQKLFE